MSNSTSTSPSENMDNTDTKISMRNLTHNKEPWLAAGLSWIHSGLGQVYMGAKAFGIFLFVLDWLLLVAGVHQILTDGGSARLGIGALVIWLGMRVFNIYDAFVNARRGNEDSFELRRKRQPDAWKGMALNAILPGLGHCFIGMWITGPVWILVAIGMWFWWLPFLEDTSLSTTPIILLQFVSQLALHLGAVAHGVLGSKARRERGNQLLYGVLLAMTLASLKGDLARRFVFLSYDVVPVSFTDMAPTLQDGDWVVLRSHEGGALRRGDLLFYLNPNRKRSRREFTIHRLAGKPGERVKISSIDGKLTVDGVAPNHPVLASVVYSAQGRFALGTGLSIPEDGLFVLGDKPDHAIDSRMYGPIMESKRLKAKATKIIWPLSRAGRVK